MQKPLLPIQISGASPAPAPARSKNSQPEGGAQFNQALKREIDQRKAPPPAQAKPGGPAKPQQADKAAVPAKAGEAAPVAKAKAGASDATSEDAAAQTGAVIAQDTMVDMLALVASFNQPPASVQAAPAAAPVIDTELAAGAAPVIDGKFAAAADAAGLDKLALAGAALLADGPVPEGQQAEFAAVLARLDGQPQDTGKSAGTDNSALTGLQKPVTGQDGAAARQEAPAAAADPLVDPGQLTTARAREAVPAEAPARELQVSAPLAAPVQQASQAMANAAHGAGAGDKIAARVGTPGWDNQVGQKIVWMVAGKEQSASLTLNPPDMGPMQVVLSVTNDHASVTFSSATPEVRQALEDAMPKLREMMSESGISLGNASVNDGSAQQQARDESPGRGVRGHGSDIVENTASGSAAEAEAKAAARPARSGELPGLVDTFA
jgi:flagellar hook-length control protein FliK